MKQEFRLRERLGFNPDETQTKSVVRESKSERQQTPDAVSYPASERWVVGNEGVDGEGEIDCVGGAELNSS